MNEQLMEIAARIRDAREIAALSEETVAGQLDLPLETYRKYENGETDIPVSVLYKLSAILSIDMSALLTGEEPRLHIYSVVRKGKGVGVERRKEYRHESLGFNFAQKKAEPFLVTVAPDLYEQPFTLNAHPGQEFNYILEGSMKLAIGNHQVVLEEGDAIFFDSNYAHGMKALNNMPVKFLAIIL